MIRTQLRRARDQFVTDLREDPYLGYLLLIAAFVMLFFVWHRLPNFATRDERWRVIDFYEVVAFYLEDPTFEGIRRGVDFGRSYGATMFLYGLVSLPIVGYAALTNQLGFFSSIPALGWGGFELWDLWQTVPAWFWTASVLAARLVNAVMAVVTVYLLYRIGTILRDRWTGRLVAVLTTFTWGLIMLAHEAGEDVPALFAMVVTLYFAVAYLGSGEPRQFLLGTAAGGLAIAFKPTAGLGGLLLGVAHLLWMRRAAIDRPDVPTRQLPLLGTVPTPTLRQLLALVRPGMLCYGLVIAATVLFVTYPRIVVRAPVPVLSLVGLVLAVAYLRRLGPLVPPTTADAQSDGGRESWLSTRDFGRLAHPAVLGFGLSAAIALVLVVANLDGLVGAAEVLPNRLERGGSNKNQLTHGWLVRPTWWWITRGFLNGLGWPLFLAGIGAVVASIPRLRERSVETDGVIVSLLGIGVVLYVYSSWSYVRTHHLLLTFPLLAILVAVALARLRTRRPALARVLVVGLVVSTGIYGGLGTLGYANTPHDQAVSYLANNAGPNDTVEVYTIHDPQEASVPHGMTVLRPARYEWADTKTRCPDFVQLTYQHALWFLAPDDYIYWSSQWGDGYNSSPILEAHFRDLLTNDEDAYEIAGRYGPTPYFLRNDRQRADQTWNLVRAGIFPRTIQYGDPQDFGVYEHMIVLERTGDCGG